MFWGWYCGQAEESYIVKSRAKTYLDEYTTMNPGTYIQTAQCFNAGVDWAVNRKELSYLYITWQLSGAGLNMKAIILSEGHTQS